MAASPSSALTSNLPDLGPVGGVQNPETVAGAKPPRSAPTNNDKLRDGIPPFLYTTAKVQPAVLAFPSVWPWVAGTAPIE